MALQERATDQALRRLTDKGLIVGPEFTARRPYPEGSRIVVKPREALGNCDPGSEMPFGLDGPICDAPPVILVAVGHCWTVECSQSVTGPGPGDFRHTWYTLDEALDDIEDFYFSKPSRVRVHYHEIFTQSRFVATNTSAVCETAEENRENNRRQLTRQAHDFERMMAEGRIPSREVADATGALTAIRAALDKLSSGAAEAPRRT